MKLLSISTDRKIFDKNSAVAGRQIGYAKGYEEVHIIVFTDKSYTETTLAPNIWVYPTHSASRWLRPWDALKLARFIVEKRGITDMTCQDPFETGLVGALVKSRHPVRLELQVHVDLGSKNFRKASWLNRSRMLVVKFTLAKADKIRVVSKRIRDYVAMIVDPAKIEVRPIFVDLEKIKNSPVTVDLHKKYPQFSKIILVASRLEREKNIPLALQAFKLVSGKLPRVGLVIVGEGREKERLQKEAGNLGLKESVIFEPWQTEMSSYYKTTDLFLNTSLYEGYGMTLVEAQAALCPVVSTDVGVAREIGATIVGFEPGDVAEKLMEKLS